ncbi:MAG: GDP-mannose 4,6-dehydratase [Dokdonella sp.]|uniref:GDP-mannose 4,6-dehydratase n=1 Tax=Dokdonella sp. TaxID=2291710 RepID=UPI003263B07B
MSGSSSTALITGISGQDGALLAAHLLHQGMNVIGTHRPGGAPDVWRLRELGVVANPRLRLVALDPLDPHACVDCVAAVAPDALFHLAGQSRVADSFRDPRGSIAANGTSTINLLEAVRTQASQAHFVLASSAEIFGEPAHSPQNETTPVAARSPYGLSKLIAHGAVGSWRASFGVRASSAILFNHESSLRDEAFVTRKLSRAVARIELGRETAIALGNLDARRDFGYAPDHVAAMAAMALRAQGDDFVLATGIASSIREFATAAFAAAGIAIDWFGEGVDEVGVEHGSERVRVRVDPAFFRPIDAPLLVGDAAKARRELGFASTFDLAGLARHMVEADGARERNPTT